MCSVSIMNKRLLEHESLLCVASSLFRQLQSLSTIQDKLQQAFRMFCAPSFHFGVGIIERCVYKSSSFEPVCAL